MINNKNNCCHSNTRKCSQNIVVIKIKQYRKIYGFINDLNVYMVKTCKLKINMHIEQTDMYTCKRNEIIEIYPII